MRAAGLLLVAVGALSCWSRDEFRSECVFAGTCVLPEADAGFDAGLDPQRWSEVTPFLFADDAGADSSFDVAFVSNLTASSLMPDQCAYVGGVTTRAGSVVCIPSEADRAIEVLLDGGVSSVSVARSAGETWAGAVLLESGAVVGLPASSASLLLLPEPKPPFPNRNPDFLPLAGVPLPLTGGARTLDGTVIASAPDAAVFLQLDDGGVRTRAVTVGDYAGAVLTESGRSALLVPRGASRLFEAIEATFPTPERVVQRGTQAVTGYAGGLLLENGDALLTPAQSGGVFLRVPADGGAPAPTTTTSRVALFSATWSTNGFAYGLDVDGGSTQVAVIDRRGNVTWPTLPSTDGGFGPLSYVGLTAMSDGRLVSCGCRARSVLILTPRHRRTLPVEVMTSPWLNKW